MNHSFGARGTIDSGGIRAGIYRLSKLAQDGIGQIDRLPFSIKVLLENALRNEDGRLFHAEDVVNLASWDADNYRAVEIPFSPARVILQDFTGVPSLVDLAALRSAMARMGGDPQKINPQVPVDLVIDHSVQVDVFGRADAIQRNSEIEFVRNRERYEFLHWGRRPLRISRWCRRRPASCIKSIWSIWRRWCSFTMIRMAKAWWRCRIRWWAQTAIRP